MWALRIGGISVLVALVFPVLQAGQASGFAEASALATAARQDRAPFARIGESPEAGRFLVANRKLRDPNFGRSVVLLVRHGAGGSMGLIVNRRSPFQLAEVLPGHPAIESRKDVLYLGGPVQPTRLLVLARGVAALEDAVPVFADVQLVVTQAGLAGMLARGLPTRSIRAYAGHAGWGAGQLDREIARGDWRVVDADVDQVFTGNPGGLWQKLIDGTLGKWVRRDPAGQSAGMGLDVEDASLACHSETCPPIRTTS